MQICLILSFGALNHPGPSPRSLAVDPFFRLTGTPVCEYTNSIERIGIFNRGGGSQRWLWLLLWGPGWFPAAHTKLLAAKFAKLLAAKFAKLLAGCSRRGQLSPVRGLVWFFDTLPFVPIFNRTRQHGIVAFFFFLKQRHVIPLRIGSLFGCNVVSNVLVSMLITLANERQRIRIKVGGKKINLFFFLQFQ